MAVAALGMSVKTAFMTRYTATNPDAKLEWSKVRSTANAMKDFKSKHGGTKRPVGADGVTVVGGGGTGT